jgi:hypothetical protein
MKTYEIVGIARITWRYDGSAVLMGLECLQRACERTEAVAVVVVEVVGVELKRYGWK